MNQPTLHDTSRRAATGVVGFGLITDDLERGQRFYKDAIGFDIVAPGQDDRVVGALRGAPGRTARTVGMQLGNTRLSLTHFDPPARAYPADSLVTDLWFQHLAIVVTDIHACYQRALRLGATPITRGAPVRLPAASGGVTAVKFRDPDGHPVEFIEYPERQAPPHWRSASSAARTLGVDHSALTVSNIAASLRFYGQLGFHPVRAGENIGPEQERLDAVADAHVQVSALQTAAGLPGVELLGYIGDGGTPIPPKRDAVDVAATHVAVSTDNVEAALAVVRGLGFRSVSRSIVAQGDSRAAMVCDPDGHLLMLTEHVGASNGPDA